MEIALKPNVRNKVIMLLQQQKELQNQINNIIDIVAECEGVALTSNSKIVLSDDISVVTITDSTEEK